MHSLIENLGSAPSLSTAPKKVVSGKLKKDKDGNWEFEYDTPTADEDSDNSENETLRNNPQERPCISAVSGDGEQDETEPAINLVCISFIQRLVDFHE